MSKVTMRLAFTLLFAFSAGAASATERVLLAPPAAVAARSVADTAAKETSPGSIKRLRARAAKNVKVRIIVGYRVPFAPEAKLSAGERAQQRREIAAAGDRLRRNYARTAANSALSGDLITLNSIPFAGLEVSEAELNRLLADPNVLTIAEDMPTAPQLAYSVPLIRAPEAWALGATGAGQTVAVLDQGAQTDHPFLRDLATGASKVVYEASCIGGSSCRAGTGSARRGSKSDAHGTSVAGIIAGERRESAPGRNDPLTGVAPGARLIVMSAFYRSEYIKALETVYELRNRYSIAAVNMSIAIADLQNNPIMLDPGPCQAMYSDFAAAISNLREAGIATVVSSGNNGVDKSTGSTTQLSVPACLPMAVSVGAVYPSQETGSKAAGNYAAYGSFPCKVYQSIVVDEVACFSNTSPGLTLLAPGFPTETSGLNGSYNTVFGGTSAAAPHVAGAFAILKSKVPKASVSQIIDALRATGKPVRDYRTGNVTPRIDAAKALEYLMKNSTFAIDYLKAGDGSGTVTMSAGAASATCTQACVKAFPQNSLVTLTATADPGMSFMGWSGSKLNCASNPTCSVTLSDTLTITATFAGRQTLSYAIRGTGAASVTFTRATGDTQDCNADCTITARTGQRVLAEVKPAPGSVFAGWGGYASYCNAATCTIDMSESRAITATVNLRSNGTPGYVLSYGKSGTGGGTLSASANGKVIPCSSATCTTTQPPGTMVTLNAMPDTTSTFTGWSGACTGSAPSCSFQLLANSSATAIFQQRPISMVSLTIMKMGPGTLGVTLNGRPLSCPGSTCSATGAAGSVVQLTATPANGAVFDGWSGACRGATPACTVTLRMGGVALATFKSRPQSLTSAR